MGSLATVDLKDWIFEENLRPWLEVLSQIVGYEFDDLDWDAVRGGITGTDVERSLWYEYPLGENSRVGVAHDPGTAVVMVRASLSAAAAERVKVAILISQSYRLVSRV